MLGEHGDSPGRAKCAWKAQWLPEREIVVVFRDTTTTKKQKELNLQICLESTATAKEHNSKRTCGSEEHMVIKEHA